MILRSYPGSNYSIVLITFAQTADKNNTQKMNFRVFSQNFPLMQRIPEWVLFWIWTVQPVFINRKLANKLQFRSSSSISKAAEALKTLHWNSEYFQGIVFISGISRTYGFKKISDLCPSWRAWTQLWYAVSLVSKLLLTMKLWYETCRDHISRINTKHFYNGIHAILYWTNCKGVWW